MIPIPESSRASAIPLAHALNVKYREGFVKNRYIGRTFIMPGQDQRTKSVQQKLNAIDFEFRGKNVLLVEDSIVRGTTTEQIVRQARKAGARKVFMAVAAPPVRYPNVYGIDMPAANEFIAYNRTEAEVAARPSASIGWSTSPSTTSSGRPQKATASSSVSSAPCFDGEYVTGDIDEGYLDTLSAVRNDRSKQRRELEQTGDSTVIELYNHA